MRRLIVLVAAMVLGALFVAPSANAAFGIESFESQTCKEDATPVSPCLGSEVPKLFTQSAGHPPAGVTAFKVNTGAFEVPEGFLKETRVELPPGLGVNPEAVATCTVAQLESLPFGAGCPPASKVGTNFLRVIVAPGPPPVAATIPVPVYNVEPPFGVPSQAGFKATGPASFLVGSLDPVDQHISFNTHVESPLEGGPPVISSRLVFEGTAGDGYLTMPSQCDGPLTTVLKAESYEGAKVEAKSITAVGVSGCENVPFKPSVDVRPEGSKEVDSPNPVTVELGIPYEKGKPNGITNSYLKTARVTLPEGMAINPSAANGLEVCTEAQFHKGTNLDVECPAGSEIGTVTVETPSLPPGSIGGKVFAAAPLKNGPNASGTGEQFRIFIWASGPARGVNVRLIGNVFPNPITGQLTAVVNENPEAPFSSFQVHLKGGDKGILTSPPTCSPATTTTDLTPWSGNLDQNTPSSSFTLTSFPGGGACPTSLGARPFAPGYTAASDSTKAGNYSPFRVNITRNNGQQELKVVNVTLPKGLTGKLAGIPYCSEADIAAAANSSGAAQKASSSCGSNSLLGTAVVTAGSGNAPFKTEGKVYLAGPYKGAPLSLAVITPAVAGPYDLGTIVVRIALNVNPITAQVNPVTDAIPDVFGGVKLDIRSIDFNVDRKKFMLNPTNCEKGATAGVINGGGSDPSNPAAFSTYNVSSPYQATGCKKLKFKPKLHVRIFGPTTRAKNTRIRAILEARKGDANIARTALNLPHSLFLDQGHIRTVCTRVQLAAKQCPKAAIYGHAEAKTPLLSKKLKGPVYLVSSNHTLPDLVADLRGQVNIQLHGVISSKHGGLKTVFPQVPDVPVTKFILNMQGGKKSLIQNSTNLCKSPQRAILNIKGQNGKKVKNNRFPLKIDKCGGSHHKKKSKK